MTDPTPPAAPDSSDVEGEPSPFRVAMGLFIVPLLLVIGGVGVFLLFGVLAHETADPAEYLAEINGRGINEPWQAAFHLSQQLQFDERLRGDEAFTRQVVAAMDKAQDGDARVRRFLAVALGRLEHPVAVPALLARLEDPDAEVRVNSLWALGRLAAVEAAPAAGGLLRDDDVSVRTMAAYVLGVLGNRAVAPALQVSLNDPVPAVRWNAAVALGLMDDPAGYDLLVKMIDRQYLAGIAGVAEQQHSETMLAALAALAALGPQGLEAPLARLRDGDPDLRVREAARRVLESPHGARLHEAGPLLTQGH